MRRAARLPITLFCAAVGTAVGGARMTTAAPPASTAPASVWAGACTYCHDEGVAPAIFGQGLAPAAIAAVVRSGLNGMPAFHSSELTDAQLKLLADWIAQQPAAPAKH